MKVSGSVVSEALKRTEQEVADKEKSTGTALSEQEKSDIYNKHLSEATAADYINKRDTIGVEAYKEYEKTVKELERQVKRKLSPDEKQIVYDDFVQNKKSQPTATTPEGQQGEFDFKYIDPAELKAQTEARGGDLFSEENLANQQRVAEAGKPPTLAELKAKSEQERISRIMQQMEEAKRNQEQGDLFKEREANKQADVESAYRQRTQQEFESAQRESEAQKRGLGEVPREDYQPSQRGPEMANPTRPTLKEATGKLFDAIAEAAGGKLNFVEGEGFHKALTDFVGSLFDAGHTTYLKAIEAAKKASGKAWEHIKPHFKAAWDYVKNVQPGMSIKDVSTKQEKQARSLSEFADRWSKEGKTPEEIQRAWDYLQSNKQAQDVKAAIDNIPGLKGVASVSNKSYEEMLPEFKAEPDIKDTWFRDLFVSGGRMKAMKTNNSLINWAVERIYGAKRNKEVIQKKAEQEILSDTHALKKTLGEEEFIAAMTELQRVEGTAEGLQKLSPQAKRLAETIRKHMDALHAATEKVTGKPKVYRPNYLAAMFTGSYRSVVRSLDSEGKLHTIGIIAGKTMDDARAAVSFFKQEFPNAVFEDPKFDNKYKSAKFHQKFEQLAVHNNELLDMFGDNPLSKEFMDKADSYYRKQMMKHLDYYQHFKSKKGVIGAEGGAPWRNALDNANDLLNAQLKVLEDGWDWVAAQEASKDIRKILNDTSLDNKANTKNYVVGYFAKVFNKDSQKFVDLSEFTNAIAQSFGIEPKVINEVSATFRNFTLSNILSLNPSFMMTQVAQIPDALARTVAFLSDRGLKGAKSSEIFVAGTHDAMMALAKKYDKLTPSGKFFNDYAVENGVFDPHILEHQRVGKLVQTTGMSPLKRRLIDNLLNSPYEAANVYSKTVSKYTIEAMEASTRSAYYMGIAHYLDSAGVPLKQAAEMADKLTSTFFVDYNIAERPEIFAKLGELGSYASAVSTFKFNWLNQLVMNMKEGNAKALTATAAIMLMTTGLQGAPGMEDIDSTLSTLTGGRISPKDFLMKHTSPLLYYGALSEATGMSLQTKFSQANIFGGDALEFLYPLASYWTSGAKKTMEAIKNRSEEHTSELQSH